MRPLRRGRGVPAKRLGPPWATGRARIRSATPTIWAAARCAVGVASRGHQGAMLLHYASGGGASVAAGYGRHGLSNVGPAGDGAPLQHLPRQFPAGPLARTVAGAAPGAMPGVVTAPLKDALKQLEKGTEEDEEIYDKMAGWRGTSDEEKVKSISDAGTRVDDPKSLGPTAARTTSRHRNTKINGKIAGWSKTGGKKKTKSISGAGMGVGDPKILGLTAARATSGLRNTKINGKIAGWRKANGKEKTRSILGPAAARTTSRHRNAKINCKIACWRETNGKKKTKSISGAGRRIKDPKILGLTAVRATSRRNAEITTAGSAT